MAKKLPARNKLLEFLRYDAKTGHFYRKTNAKRADTPMSIGYRRVRLNIDGFHHEFLAHRAAWLMAYGVWPENEIDHINGDRNDNSISNLRHVTRTKNARNTKLRCDNSSGLSGLSKTSYGAWRVRISTNHIGCYPTKNEAIAARAKYLSENGFTQRHGRAEL
jgi:hypothetical protein